MISDNPTEEEVKELLDGLLPGWQWVFADWADADIMGRHVAGLPQENIQAWIDGTVQLRQHDPNFKQVNKRLALIGAVVRFTVPQHDRAAWQGVPLPRP